MLKAVAQAIPLYVISCFRMSKSFLHELNMIFAHFWWGDTNNRKRIHWKKWDALCCSKLDGGFGLKDLESLIWLCWQNNGGEFFIVKILFVTKCYKLDIFQDLLQQKH